MRTPVLLRIALAAALAAALPSLAAAGPGGSVVGSKHDLSVRGPGPIRAVTERSACIFCHVSHNSGAQLTNRPDSSAAVQPYASSTMAARAGSPTGASRVCLSCHDGTIAVGDTRTRRIAMLGGAGGKLPPGHRANIGTDLRRTHPVSFRPQASRKARAPLVSDAVHLDRTGELQCTSCHDPHAEWGDPQVGKFLVKPLRRSELCLSCHDRSTYEAPGASHAASIARFGPAEGNDEKFDSVGDAGCVACHASHNTEAGARLVRRRANDDDDACLRCHAGAVVRRPLGAEVAKASSHAGHGAGRHDAAEADLSPRGIAPRPNAGASRHAACVDCHNPHHASDRPAVGGVSGALAGVWGVDAAGRRVEQVRFEYELCFKCHGDDAGRSQELARPGAPRRAIPDPSLRRVFDPSSPSSHPVVSPRRALNVPSLLPPWNAQPNVTCGDCHGSDSAAAPKGPHGSNQPFMLARTYATGDRAVEGPQTYALCYRCHDRDVLLSDRSTFPSHRLHVVTGSATCSTCHAAHGVSYQSGSTDANAHLVDFDIGVVGAGPTGPARYQATGLGHGTCTLTCHGVPHDAKSY